MEKGPFTWLGLLHKNVRGIVGDTGGHGYDKNYSHDPRMLYTSPPHYIEPSNTGWQAMQWREISDPITSTPYRDFNRIMREAACIQKS